MGNVAVNVAEYARWLPASNQCNIALCWALKYFIRAYSASLFVSSPREIISRCNHSLICVLQLFSLGLCLIRRCALVRCLTMRQNVVEKFGGHFFFYFLSYNHPGLSRNRNRQQLYLLPHKNDSETRRLLSTRFD